MCDDQALYRFFAADGSLLYIGISLHPFARMSQHRYDKSWWGEVASVTIARYPSRREVEMAEREAIRAEHPRYNVVHSPSRPKLQRPEQQPKAARVWHGWHPSVFMQACPTCTRTQCPTSVEDEGEDLFAVYDCVKRCGAVWTQAHDKADLHAKRRRSPWLYSGDATRLSLA